MVRKTVSILMITIGVFMFYAVCDGDDGSMMHSWFTFICSLTKVDKTDIVSS